LSSLVVTAVLIIFLFSPQLVGLTLVFGGGSPYSDPTVDIFTLCVQSVTVRADIGNDTLCKTNITHPCSTLSAALKLANEVSTVLFYSSSRLCESNLTSSAYSITIVGQTPQSVLNCCNQSCFAFSASQTLSLVNITLLNSTSLFATDRSAGSVTLRSVVSPMAFRLNMSVGSDLTIDRSWFNSSFDLRAHRLTAASVLSSSFVDSSVVRFDLTRIDSFSLASTFFTNIAWLSFSLTDGDSSTVDGLTLSNVALASPLFFSQISAASFKRVICIDRVFSVGPVLAIDSISTSLTLSSSSLVSPFSISAVVAISRSLSTVLSDLSLQHSTHGSFLSSFCFLFSSFSD
jgi:hypothetical protein